MGNFALVRIINVKILIMNVPDTLFDNTAHARYNQSL